MYITIRVVDVYIATTVNSFMVNITGRHVLLIFLSPLLLLYPPQLDQTTGCSGVETAIHTGHCTINLVNFQ